MPARVALLTLSKAITLPQGILRGWGFPNIAFRIQYKITNLYQIPGKFYLHPSHLSPLAMLNLSSFSPARHTMNMAMMGVRRVFYKLPVVAQAHCF